MYKETTSMFQDKSEMTILTVKKDKNSENFEKSVYMNTY